MTAEFIEKNLKKYKKDLLEIYKKHKMKNSKKEKKKKIIQAKTQINSLNKNINKAQNQQQKTKIENNPKQQKNKPKN